MNELELSHEGGETDIAGFSKQGLKLLISELMLQKRNLDLLRRQNAALLSCNRRVFVELHEQYVVLVGELEVQSILRIRHFGERRVESLIQSWPETEKRNSMRVLGELRTVVTDIQRINTQNGKLVGTQMKYIDFMLNVLISTYRKGSTYGPQGAQSINRGNLFFNSAA
jgi:flagellar biosynthesis/type III secretory pathway chaperone